MLASDEMKIGNYVIPEYRLQDLIEETKKIYEKFNAEEVELEFIAHLLGQSPKSGSFYKKIAALRDYGLIEGRGKIRVSEVGKKVTFGDESEKNSALEKAVRNIPLWSMFLDKFGVSIKEESFWIDLAKLAAVERPEAQMKAEGVRKAYIETVKYLKPIENPSESANSSTINMGGAINRNENKMTLPEEPRVPIENKVKPEDIDEINLGKIRIWIPKGDIKAVSKAKKLLDLYIEDFTEDTTTAG